jgi:hypothetical protein
MKNGGFLGQRYLQEGGVIQEYVGILFSTPREKRGASEKIE